MIPGPPPLEIAALTSADLARRGVRFAAGDRLYETTGERIGQGGMGSAFHLHAWRAGEPSVARVVGKLFRDEFLARVVQDPAAVRHFEHNLHVIDRVSRLRDLHVLPVLWAQRITDNFLVLTPYAGEPLVSVVAQEDLPPRERIALLVGALRGLRALHEAQVVHCDVTLRNVLVSGNEAARHAVLFDFDLSIALDLLGPGTTYLEHYDGRVVGSPEYSVAPEQLDAVLGRAPLSPRRDVYAAGTALFGLFTDASVYGPVADLPSLLQRIGEGVVRRGESRVAFPDEVPEAVRGVILRCLERDPEHRYADADALIRALEAAASRLAPRAGARFHSTFDYIQAPRAVPIAEILQARPDPSVSAEEIRELQAVLARHGYQLERSLGRMKGHALFAARPDPMLVATGRFLEPNAYRKIVTAIDLRARPDADVYAATWLGRIQPVLDRVRHAFLTALHKVTVDRPSGRLLLFSEHIDDPRFGPQLAGEELTLEEALGLALILADQLAHLHGEGLAHNNVSLEALMFKCLPETGEVRPFLVGLVDPSFEPAARADDVRRLAGIVAALLRPSRLDAQPAEYRPALVALRLGLEAVGLGREVAPPVGTLVEVLGDALALVEPNFEVVRRHGGDPVRFARMLTRHALYRRLWGRRA